jgi:hypothetical protein
MTAWAKALNACQTADLLENRNSDRPSHSPAHIGPGADVGDRQRKLLSCIFRFTPGRLSRLDREFQSIELRSVFVCRCFRISGAQPRTGKCRPPSQPKRLLCVTAAPAATASAAAHPVSCVPKRRSQAFPEEMGQTHIRQEDYAKVERKTSAFAEMPSTKGKHTLLKTRAHRLLSNALQPNHSNALRRGGVGCR